MGGYVYRFLGENGEILYIGKTKNMTARMYHHFHTGHLTPEQYSKVKKTEYAEYLSYSDAGIAERVLINRYSPPFNTVHVSNDPITLEIEINHDWKEYNPTDFEKPKLKKPRRKSPEQLRMEMVQERAKTRLNIYDDSTICRGYKQKGKSRITPCEEDYVRAGALYRFLKNYGVRVVCALPYLLGTEMKDTRVISASIDPITRLEVKANLESYLGRDHPEVKDFTSYFYGDIGMIRDETDLRIANVMMDMLNDSMNEIKKGIESYNKIKEGMVNSI